MIAAVSNRGLMRFMLYDGALTANRFVAFLRRLVRDAGQKVILIPAFARTDNLTVHKTGEVQAWVESHRHESSCATCRPRLSSGQALRA